MPMPPASVPPGELHDAVCPFCGLLCDDLSLESSRAGLRVTANGCPLAEAGFRRDAVKAPVTPRVDGRPATLEEAVTAAAGLLQQASQPVIGGLGTDLAGVRAAAQLGERIGAVLDHMNSAAALRNTLVLQDSGWITTTLSEVRNHADLLVVAGTDVESRLPRFFERCVENRETLFTDQRRCEVIFLGRGPAPRTAARLEAALIECDVTRLHEAFAALRTILAGRPLGRADAAGVPLEVWRNLAERLKAARYGVVAWAAADLDFPQAELTVQGITELVRDVNRYTRCAGLPLGGSDGDVTADMALLWQTGFGLRTSLARGIPEYDAHHHSVARMVATRTTDLLLWISSFSATRTPPPTETPTVVLGHAGMALEREPAVFIPVGTPGVEHEGHLFRTDRVVALPLQQARPSTLPTVAQVCGAIEAALPQESPC